MLNDSCIYLKAIGEAYLETSQTYAMEFFRNKTLS